MACRRSVMCMRGADLGGGRATGAPLVHGNECRLYPLRDRVTLQCPSRASCMYLEAQAAQTQQLHLLVLLNGRRTGRSTWRMCVCGSQRAAAGHLVHPCKPVATALLPRSSKLGRARVCMWLVESAKKAFWIPSRVGLQVSISGGLSSLCPGLVMDIASSSCQADCTQRVVCGGASSRRCAVAARIGEPSPGRR